MNNSPAKSNSFETIRNTFPYGANLRDVNWCLAGYSLAVLLPGLNGFSGFFLSGALHFLLLLPGLLVMLVGARHYLRNKEVVLLIPAAALLGIVCSGIAFAAYYFFNWFLWMLAN